jgi:hypothetical protein
MTGVVLSKACVASLDIILARDSDGLVWGELNGSDNG